MSYSGRCLYSRRESPWRPIGKRAVDEAQIHELKYLMNELAFHRSGIRIVRLEDAYQMLTRRQNRRNL